MSDTCTSMTSSSSSEINIFEQLPVAILSAACFELSLKLNGTKVDR